MKIEFVKTPNYEHYQIRVEGEGVGDVLMKLTGNVSFHPDGWKYSLSSYVDNFFSPAYVVQLRTAANNFETVLNVTRRLKGKP